MAWIRYVEKFKCFNNYIYQNNPPPIPPKRDYVIHNGERLNFPQIRRLKSSFKEPSGEVFIPAGEEVLVTGMSPIPAHFLVQNANRVLQIGHQNFKPV